MALPIVAVVGRPNVGKSTLFNKLIGQRLSIVEDTPGVTRDRIYSKCEWRGKEFMVVDTGGIEPDSNDVILAQMRRQSELAIEKADVIVFVTDIRCGVTADDYAVAEMLIKSGKPIVLAVNKVDKLGEPPLELYEFYNLGLGEPYPISSVHGHGTGDMLDAIYDYLPETNEEEYGEDAELLSGDVAQEKRLKILDRFREGRTRILVATDVAARGIHVDGISHVVNYDLPEQADDYVHRIGRTGRAGEHGISISFADEFGSFVLPQLEQYTKCEIRTVQPPQEWLELPEKTRELPPEERARMNRRHGGSGGGRPHRGGGRRGRR